MVAHSQGAVIAAAAAAGAAAGAAICALYYLRSNASAQPPSPRPPSLAPTAIPLASVRNFDEDDILAEQLTRNVQFFGLENQKLIAQSFVVVVGLGVRVASSGCSSRLWTPTHRSVLCRAWAAMQRTYYYGLVWANSGL